MTARIVQTKGKGVDKKFFAASTGCATGVVVALRKAVNTSVRLENIAIARMAGSDMKLSNQGRAMRAKGGLRNQQKAFGVAVIGPTGPVALIENGANAHLIGAGRALKMNKKGVLPKTAVMGFTNTFSAYSSTKLNRRKRLHIGDRWVTGPVHHPGMKGKGEWKKMRDGPLRTAVAQDMRAPITRGILGAFR